MAAGPEGGMEGMEGMEAGMESGMNLGQVSAAMGNRY